MNKHKKGILIGATITGIGAFVTSVGTECVKTKNPAGWLVGGSLFAVGFGLTLVGALGAGGEMIKDVYFKEQ